MAYNSDNLINEINLNYDKRKKKIICINCGKIGHEYKTCSEAIISNGIININIDIDDIKTCKDLMADIPDTSCASHKGLHKKLSKDFKDFKNLKELKSDKQNKQNKQNTHNETHLRPNIINSPSGHELLSLSQNDNARSFMSNSDQKPIYDVTQPFDPDNITNEAHCVTSQWGIKPPNQSITLLPTGFTKKKLKKYIRSTFTTKKKNIYKITSEINKDITYIYHDNLKIINQNSNMDITILNSKINCPTPNDVQKFYFYRDKIKFLMVKRKYSLGFIEFIRGRYELNDFDSIINLFEQMTIDEINMIKNEDYDTLIYKFLSKNTENKELFLEKIYSDNRYSTEYILAKNKYNDLLNASVAKDDKFNNSQNILGLSFYTENIKPKWKYGEWGFPKGRRNKNDENNLMCAMREFEEETGISKNEYFVLNKIEPIEENLIGTNGIKYKHIYFLSYNNDSAIHNKQLEPIDNNEIGEIKWFTFEEALKYIRPYHNERKSILTQIYSFLMNFLIHLSIE